MGTDSKRSLIVLREKGQVDRYFQEIAEQNLSATIVVDNKVVFENCRFVGRERNVLIVEAGQASGRCPGSGDALVTCTGSHHRYIFATKVLSAESAEHPPVRFSIKYPERITKDEERKDVRVKPSKSQPVSVRLVAKGETMRVAPVDISQGGISFVLTEEATKFKTGDVIGLLITIPLSGELTIEGTVRNVIHLMDLTRIGIAFTSLPNDARTAITEYVEKRRRQLDRERSSGGI